MRALLVGSVLFLGCATTSASVTPSPQPPAAAPAPVNEACPTKLPTWSEGAVPAGAIIGRVCLIGAHEDDFLRLNEMIAPREGTRLEADAVREDIEALMAPGYVKDVVVVAEPLADQRVKLIYAVAPHDRVGEVRLDGVQALTLDDVDEVAKVGLPASGVMLRAVRGAFVKVYELHGYPHAEVHARLEPTKPGLQALVLTVKEGPRLALGPIAFVGAKKVPTAEMKKVLTSATGAVYSADAVERDALGPEKPALAALKTKSKAVFSRSVVRDDIERLKALGKKRGVDLNVTPITEVKSDEKRIDLTFELEPAR